MGRDEILEPLKDGSSLFKIDVFAGVHLILHFLNLQRVLNCQEVANVVANRSLSAPKHLHQRFVG